MREKTVISSTRNERIRRLVLLCEKSSARREEGQFVVEGMREITQCMRAGYDINALYYCEEIMVPCLEAAQAMDRYPSFPVTRKVYERVAYRGSTEGIVAEVRYRDTGLADLELGRSPLVIVLESVEKPGNLGAILRTADAAGVDAVIVCDPLTDMHNPNLIRSSLGAAFTVPCVACTTGECLAFLRGRGIRILTAQLQDSRPYHSADMRGATAIVMGSEAKGLTPEWRRAADEHIMIPMLGHVDSLNVSTSAAILVYEAVRQRMGKEKSG